MCPLPTDLEPLLHISVAIVQGDWKRLRELRLGASPGQPNRAWREAVLQTHLFAGFPRLVEALGVIEKAGGLGEVQPEECMPPCDESEDIARGFDFFGQIYGDGAGRIRDMLDGYHPEWGRWILGHAYGRVLARPGLSPDRRELCAVVCLAALDQERQLASHARGAVRCGATPAAVRAALQAVEDRLNPELVARAKTVIGAFARE
ncbi:MAG: alkylhydroperoxidase/carboxymuconolactone decarboxylase family protein YurZ [Planctomycetota bacterium]|jgi:alkylhydroperoxidase/carboxymuconolactone decarboxylase family protein YurZ